MTTEEQIKTLRRLIGALKSKLTRTEKILEKPVDSIDLLELKTKIADLNSVKLNFEEKQTELESIVSDEEIDNEYEIRGDFENKLSTLHAKPKRIIKTNEPPNVNHLQSRSNSQNTIDSVTTQAVNSNSASIHRSDKNTINIKLLALKPTFSGAYEKCPGFSDVFKSSVHND